MDTYDTIKYILDNYSEYIDTLQIQKLRLLLESSSDGYVHGYTTREIDKVFEEIVQLIVDDLGCDVVNKIEILEHGYVLYENVKFKDHVVIDKNEIATNEFLGASFLNGVTVKNHYLPSGALMNCRMFGIVDLTQIEILGDDNLNFIPNAKGCKVLLSNNLTTLKGTSVFKFPSNIEVEYKGTMLQLTKLVKNYYKLLNTSQRKYFKSRTGYGKIKCDDGGVWTLDVYSKLARKLK